MPTISGSPTNSADSHTINKMTGSELTLPVITSIIKEYISNLNVTTMSSIQPE